VRDFCFAIANAPGIVEASSPTWHIDMTTRFACFAARLAAISFE
jgi:hypothetical protein